MRQDRKARPAVCWLLCGLLCLAGSSLAAAEEELNEALIEMIVGLLGDEERDMRALGLQQIREEVPGEAATKRFAELLPKLPPDTQAGLLEALGDRGDAAARPAVLEMLTSKTETVRAAALKALGGLGTASQVPLLAEKAAAGPPLERSAARQSLIRLRGDDVNAALVAAMTKGEPKVRVELLGILAARNAREALPQVLKSAEDPQSAVRLAALGALRFLADEKDAVAMVGLVKAADNDTERLKAELALLAVCTRGGEACADAIIAGLGDASPAARVSLLHALARAGGPKALEAVAARLQDDAPSVRDEAMRVLSGWPDPAVIPRLLDIARTSDSLRHHVLAIRGLVRLASPGQKKPADVELLAEVTKLSKRPQEKRLVLGVLGGVPASEALRLALAALDDAALTEEAGLAAVMIAEKMKDRNNGELRSAMQKVLGAVRGQQLRQRAQKVLESL